MGSTSDVQMPPSAEDSETTIEIKIKTLDSQTYNLRVNKCVPVPLLKEKIATITGILSEQQRLICRGRVLKDDELLSAYHVENGHTLHLVIRHPGQATASGNAASEANTPDSGWRRARGVARSIVVEAVNVDHEVSELPGVAAEIIQRIFGLPISRQYLGAPAPSETRPSETTQSSIPSTVRVEFDQQQAPFFQPEPVHGSLPPNVIPDALTTISQYMDFMRDSFRREGFNPNGQAEGNAENRTAGSSVGGTGNQESQPDSASTLRLPTAALLGETMHSTRQIVVEQAGALLSQLSTQLGGLVNVSDLATRRSLQSSVMRSGVLLQNLGSLLLELGRATMMLRINPASSEAHVNSGPALFISPSGPNSLMVQPVPFFPGRSVQMGTVFSNLGSQGSVLHPRAVDVHGHTSGSAPVADTNPSEPAAAQAQQHTNRTGDASHPNIGEAFAGVAGGAPFSVESGVRLLPLRTVVAAMLAGISQAPSGSSSGGVGIIYPMLTRIQQRVNTNGNDERNGQSPTDAARSSSHPNQQTIPYSSQTREAGNLGSPIDVNVGNSFDTTPGQHSGMNPFFQLLDNLRALISGDNGRTNGTSQQAPMVSGEQGDAGNSGTPEVSGVSEDGLRFANIVRQIMPFISQAETHENAAVDGSSTPPPASDSSNRARDGPGDSRSFNQHNHDQPEEPNSKRQRTSD